MAGTPDFRPDRARWLRDELGTQGDRYPTTHPSSFLFLPSIHHSFTSHLPIIHLSSPCHPSIHHRPPIFTEHRPRLPWGTSKHVPACHRVREGEREEGNRAGVVRRVSPSRRLLSRHPVRKPGLAELGGQGR